MTIRRCYEWRSNATVFDVAVDNRVARHQRARSTEGAAISAGAGHGGIRKTAIRPKFSQALEKTDLFLAEAREYAALGISQLDVLPDRNPVEYIERVAHLVPVLAAL
jgi:hypothetical protein